MALPLHSYQKKRIIVCCDGTWDNSDNGYDKEKHALIIPSNVTRFIRALSIGDDVLDKISGGNINTKDNSPIFKLAREQVRTPGQYYKVNNQTGEQRKDHQPLENTRERIHSSVHVCLASSMSKGVNDQGKYLTEALTAEKQNTVLNRFLSPRYVLRHGWKLCENDKTNLVAWNNDFADIERDMPLSYWTCADSGEGFPNVMVEDTLGVWEKKLLEIQGPEKSFEGFLSNEQWMSISLM
ncbi:hypothetical protein N7486_005391 [Penicillium sp. IBT 16267x]|nr:hypothetical protein N7486_005391 [Penicillium sp. IBT 16267x]